MKKKFSYKMFAALVLTFLCSAFLTAFILDTESRVGTIDVTSLQRNGSGANRCMVFQCRSFAGIA